MSEIVTVTLNPAIDKRYIIEKFSFGTVMRVKKCVNTAGGKGLNVTKVLQILGANVLATGIIGGNSGQFILGELNNKIKNNFFITKRETRSCINFFDEATGTQSEFLEPGESIEQFETIAFIKHFEEQIENAKIVTMSGSAVQGFNKDIYANLIKICNLRNIKVILDTSGDYLLNGIKACPHIVKPNEDEVKALDSGGDIINTAKKYIDAGVNQFIISLGAKGSLTVTKDGSYRAIPPKIKAVNTVGCGDSMIAGLAYAELKNMDITEKLRFATAVSAANALQETTGHVTLEDVKKLQQETEILRI